MLVPIPDEIGLQTISFQSIKRASVARTEGRHVQSVESPYSYWTAICQTTLLNEAQFGVFRSFMMDIGPGGSAFLMHDRKRPRPIEYAGAPLSGLNASGGPFDGTAGIQSISNSREVEVSGLPAGFQLRTGDYVEFRNSDTVRSLHVVRDDVVSTSAGIAIVKFNHGLDQNTFTLASTVNFEKPSCKMQRFEMFEINSEAAVGSGRFTVEEVFL